jgi:hypothetical protein
MATSKTTTVTLVRYPVINLSQGHNRKLKLALKFDVIASKKFSSTLLGCLMDV